MEFDYLGKKAFDYLLVVFKLRDKFKAIMDLTVVFTAVMFRGTLLFLLGCSDRLMRI